MDQPGAPNGGADTRTGRQARLRASARRWSLFASGVVAALVAVLLFSVLTRGPAPLTQQDVQAGIASALASLTPPPARSQLIYAEIRPSLVLIEVSGVHAATSAAPAAKGSPDPSEGTNGLGSGVVVNEDGTILTSLHVVDGASAIKVTFADGSTSAASISATDPANDIAVIAPVTPPATIVPAPLGNPRSMQVGSEAYVVGNPFGLVGSMSAGVVSGLDRTLTPEGGGTTLHGLIQVDAAVNPGNSGGPLLNRDGQVVGIVAALLNPTKQDVFVGIGLAVPIDVAGGAAGLPPY